MEYDASVIAFNELTGIGMLELASGEKLPLLTDPNGEFGALIVGQKVCFDRATVAVNVKAQDGTEPRFFVDSQGRKVKES